ncbi:MAG TPA: hypothetical protein PL168_01045 [Methanobacterium sp.]|nr:hypothetical protein [Methanobacterium sp.]HOI39294.1 hypothetical protein [Methanobacterium sp.]
MQPKNLILAGGMISIFIIVFYFIGVGPTNLEITSKDSAMDKDIDTLNISGTTEDYATITINGENVPVDKNGKFYKVVKLPNGTTMYYVDAKAPFKYTKQINITAKRNEHSDGSVSGVWFYNDTLKKEYY